jgi:hypothetical protein
MYATREQKLAAKVKAVNHAHAIANEWCPKLRAIFTQFVGKQIEKKDGPLLEKIKKFLPDFPSTPFLQIYRHRSDYSLAWTVKTSEMDTDHTCLYHETTFYVGDLDHGILVKVLDNECNYRTDYTTEEISEKRREYNEAKREADEARDNLFPFGEMDN